MERLKQYTAAITVAAVALVFLIIGVLAMTVFRPAQELSSSVTPASSIVMTRDGVLPLLNENVTVTATSASGAKVALGLGTPGDVIGWIGDDPYTEVVGLTSDRAVLKTVEHAEASPPGIQSGVQSGAQSGPRSAAQSGAQSGAQSQGTQLVEALGSSDMWLTAMSDEGSATLELTKVPTGRSIIAASAGSSDDLTLTLTWVTQRINVLAIGAFLAAIVLGLVALVAFISRYKLIRHRRERAERIATTVGADVTETQTIDTAKIAEMVEADSTAKVGETLDTGTDEDVDHHTVAPAEDTSDLLKDTYGVDRTGTEEASQPLGEAEPVDDLVGHGQLGDVAAHDAFVERIPSDAPAWSDALAAVNVDDETGLDDAVNRDDIADRADAPASFEEAPPHNDETESDGNDESRPPAIRGRHGAPSRFPDEDPPEKIPTDTGIIDLSSVRPGAAFPSRRALREARAKGEGRLVIGGREFDTGLIPVVETDTPETDSPSSDSDSASQASTGGWASLMSEWLQDRDGEEKQ